LRVVHSERGERVDNGLLVRDVLLSPGDEVPGLTDEDPVERGALPEWEGLLRRDHCTDDRAQDGGEPRLAGDETGSHHSDGEQDAKNTEEDIPTVVEPVTSQAIPFECLNFRDEFVGRRFKDREGRCGSLLGWGLYRVGEGVLEKAARYCSPALASNRLKERSREAHLWWPWVPPRRK